MNKLFYFFWLSFVLLLFQTPAFAVTDTFNNPQDSYVRESSPDKNYGNEGILIADGISQDPDNGIFGEVATLAQWDLSSIPATATVTGVNVIFHYSNSSSGPYNFYSQDSPWAEGTVTWNDLDQGGNLLGTIPPLTFGQGIHPLNADGIALVQGWVDGSIDNNGLMVRSGGTNDGIAMDSKEGGRSPVLEVTYTDVKSEFYALAACTFKARDSSQRTICPTFDGGMRYEGSSGVVAPVNLPHQATIKKVTFYYRDQSNAARLRVRFLKEDLLSGFFLIGEGVSITSLGFRSTSFLPTGIPTTSDVNNESESLLMEVLPVNQLNLSLTQWPTDDSLLLKGVVIEYTLPEN